MPKRTKCRLPPFMGPIFALYGLFSRLLENFLARYARSSAVYKIYVLEIRNLDMQHNFLVQLYFSIIVDSFQSALQH